MIPKNAQGNLYVVTFPGGYLYLHLVASTLSPRTAGPAAVLSHKCGIPLLLERRPNCARRSLASTVSVRSGRCVTALSLQMSLPLVSSSLFKPSRASSGSNRQVAGRQARLSLKARRGGPCTTDIPQPCDFLPAKPPSDQEP